MAKQSKGFRELLKQEQKATDYSQKALDNLAQKFQQSPLSKQVEGIIQNPQDQVKMSEVLEAFAEPYLRDIDGYTRQHAFIELAVIAWNLAILPEEARQSAKDDLQSKLREKKRVKDQDFFDSLLDELVERKLQHFPNHRRLIMDFQFEEAGDQYHLSVASLQAPPQQQ